MRKLLDMACPWCGAHEVTECIDCEHASCDVCTAGGECDCVDTK